MKKIFSKAAIAAVLAAASFAANAVTYTFSYTLTTFGVGTLVNGSFDGSAISTDGLITGLTDIHASYGGVALDNGAELVNYGLIGGAGTAVVSVDGSANNFLFNSASGESLFYGASVGYSPSKDIYSFGTASNWTLTAAPVPEPETYGMLLGGLGMLAFVARRRNSGDRA